jgi:hypothetical protein
VVIDELVIRLVAEGIAQTKAELAQQIKDAHDAQKKLDSMTDKAEAKRAAAAERTRKAQEKEARAAVQGQNKLREAVEKVERALEKERAQAVKTAAQAAAAAVSAAAKTRAANELAAAKALKLQEQAAKKAEALAAKQAAASKARAGEFFTSLQKVDGFLTSMVQKAAVVLTAGFGAAAMAVKSFAKESSELETAAHYTSLTTDRLQELQYAAEQNGMTAEKFRDGLRQMNAGMRESIKAGGKGAVAEAINDLGIGFKNFIQMKPDEQVFAVVDAMQKFGPSAHRAGASAKLFGEIAGAGMARVADQGREALEKTAKEAHKFGAVLSHDAITAGVRLNQQILTLKGALGGLSNAIGVQLLPLATELVVGLRGWVHENRGLIALRVKEWVTGLVDVGRPFLKWLIDASKYGEDFLKIVKEWGPTLLATAAAIKGLVIAKEATVLIQGLAGAFTGATAGATGFAALLGPQGALFAGLVATIPLMVKLGSLIGDIGKQDTGKRAGLAKRLALSVPTAAGRIAGENRFIEDLSKMSQADFEAVRTETRTLGSSSPAHKSALDEIFQRADDARRFRTNQEEQNKAIADSVVEGLARFSDKRLEKMVAAGSITQEQADLARDQRNAGRFMGERPKDKKDKKDKQVTDEELAKLIASAAKSGANLEDVLKGRKIAGGVPPVITVRIFRFDINAPITVTGKQGQSTGQLAQDVRIEFQTMLEREIQKHSTEILEAR